MTRDRETAEDLVQEVFVRVYMYADRFDRSKRSTGGHDQMGGAR
jgi:DNA-directed RNA polymerase specialized sigma24 family protein